MKKQTFLLMGIVMGIMIGCSTSKDITAPKLSTEQSIASQITEDPSVEGADSVVLYPDQTCFDGTFYNVTGRAFGIKPTDSLWASYIFQGQTLDKRLLPSLKGTQHFPLLTGESGCGGTIKMWLVRGGVKIAKDTMQGNCVSCGPDVNSRPLAGIACSCTDTGKTTYHVWIQVDRLNAGDQLQLRLLNSSGQVINTVYPDNVLGDQYLKIKYEICGDGKLSLVIIRDGNTWIGNQWPNSCSPTHFCAVSGGNDCP